MSSDGRHPLLKVQHLSYTLPHKTLWHDLNFTIYAGHSIGLMGPSGSGKTVLLRALVGLEYLTTGQIWLHERLQSDWIMPQYRTHVMYLPQRAQPVLTSLNASVLQELQQPFLLAVHRSKVFDFELAQRHLTALGRDQSFINQPLDSLSGGELQLLALVRALLLNPQILLLDEATSALDHTTTLACERLLLQWCTEQPARALVWVTHQTDQQQRVGRTQLHLTPA